MIVTVVNTRSPVIFLSETESEAMLKVANWARHVWSVNFRMPCPTDLDVVIARVLKELDVEVNHYG